jgi:hypothetical protein
MAKTLVEFPDAVIGSLNVSINVTDDLVITGVSQGQTVGQTLTVQFPASVYFNPDNLNFYVPQDLLGLKVLLDEFPNLRFWKAVKGLQGI